MKQNHFFRVLGAVTLTAGMGLTCISSSQASFTPPKGNPAPQRSSGGASRGNLCQQSTPLVVAGESALKGVLPENNYGHTVSARPTILVYLPTVGAQEAFFSLKDEDKNLHYQMNVSLSGKEGIVTIELPQEAPELAMGKNYQWYFALKCDGRIHPSHPFIDGWIKRVETTNALNQDNPLALAKSFGAQGIWYDAVATLASLRKTQPTDTAVANDWHNLLSSVGLDALTDAPLVESR